MSNPRAPRSLRPTQSWAPEVLAMAKGISVAIFDVDGVLTDGTVYLDEHGECFKPFHTLDGQGLKLLVMAGITPVVITGRDSKAVRKRVQDLGLKHAVYGAHDKLLAAQTLLAELDVAWDRVAVMGDDWPDLPLMVRAAWAVAPAQAHIEARAAAHWVTPSRGGQGAAREMCDLLLAANGWYERLLQGVLTTLDGGTQ